LATFSKLVVTLVPIFVMNVNAATETRLAMTAYSIAVAPF